MIATSACPCPAPQCCLFFRQGQHVAEQPRLTARGVCRTSTLDTAALPATWATVSCSHPPPSARKLVTLMEMLPGGEQATCGAKV